MVAQAAGRHPGCATEPNEPVLQGARAAGRLQMARARPRAPPWAPGGPPHPIKGRRALWVHADHGLAARRAQSSLWVLN